MKVHPDCRWINMVEVLDFGPVLRLAVRGTVGESQRAFVVSVPADGDVTIVTLGGERDLRSFLKNNGGTQVDFLANGMPLRVSIDLSIDLKQSTIAAHASVRRDGTEVFRTQLARGPGIHEFDPTAIVLSSLKNVDQQFLLIGYGSVVTQISHVIEQR